MGLLSKLKAALFGVVAFFVIVFLAWRKGKSDGKTEERIDVIVDAHERQDKTIEVSNDVESKINSLPSGASDRRLRTGWMRKDD